MRQPRLVGGEIYRRPWRNGRSWIVLPELVPPCLFSTFFESLHRLSRETLCEPILAFSPTTTNHFLPSTHHYQRSSNFNHGVSFPILCHGLGHVGLALFGCGTTDLVSESTYLQVATRRYVCKRANKPWLEGGQKAKIKWKQLTPVTNAPLFFLLLVHYSDFG